MDGSDRKSEVPTVAGMLPEELDQLVQELEGATGTQEPVPQEVDEHLQVLQSGSLSLTRRHAAEALGHVGTSSERIVRALIAASESDPNPDVREAAAVSLRAPVHQEYLKQHPDLMEATKRALKRVPGKGRTGRTRQRQRSRSLARSLMWSSGAGLGAGLLIGRWYAEQALSSSGGSAVSGAGIVVAVVAGAVVGTVAAAVVGQAEQEGKDRIAGMALGALLAALLSALSFSSSFLWRVLEVMGA